MSSQVSKQLADVALQDFRPDRRDLSENSLSPTCASSMHVSKNKGPRNLKSVVHGPAKLAQAARILDGLPGIIAGHV